ncbi:O-antigen ligase family protein [Labilibaculum sp. DW002]|uniref:O-antigen ligase family protein n=1 Tax=Paralabilibaculum antarcticum TaxID=2912572 RepID=A0ABT5VR88_9BACT|nr:O-antigen ligase family protein [Labilibaculum sp. DW002]MDE5417940.1 O-antigen ligase family protein [Labilibaculum sp. DW002]
MLKIVNKYKGQIIPLLLIAILLSSCFVVDNSLFRGNITAKCLWIQQFGILAMVFTGMKLLFRKGVNIYFIDIFIVLFVLWMLVRELFTNMPNDNPQQYLITSGIYFVLYLFFRQIRNSSLVVLSVILIYLTIVSVQAIIGLLQLYGLMYSYHSLFNITGSFHNPGPFSGYILSGVPMALGLYLTTRKKLDENIIEDINDSNSNLKTIIRWKINILRQINALNSRILMNYYSQIVLIVLLIALSATHSRAAWLGAIASSLYILWLFRSELKKYPGIHHVLMAFNALQKKVIAVSVGLTIVISLFGLYKFKEGSANGRLLMWQVSWEMIKDKPLAGWGVGGFEAKYGDYQAEWFRNGTGTVEQSMVAGIPDAPFNEIIRLVVAYGAVGVLFCIGFLVILFRKQVYSVRSEKKPTENMVVLLKGALLSILCFSLFSYTLDIAPIVVQLIILFALIISLQEYKTVILPLNISGKFKLVLVKGIGLILLVLLPFSGKIIWQQYGGYQCWKEAYQLYQYPIYDDAAEEYQRASGILSNNGLLLQMHGKCLLMNEEFTEAKIVLEKAKLYRSDPILYTALGDTYRALKEYEKAEKAYLQAWYIIPHKFYPKYLLAKLYDETGQTTKSKRIAKELLNKKVKVKSKAIEEMRSELAKILVK